MNKLIFHVICRSGREFFGHLSAADDRSAREMIVEYLKSIDEEFKDLTLMGVTSSDFRIGEVKMGIK